jgi:UDP-N-acetylglucosamine 2-epimerase (non-hydrolysing)
MGLVLNSGAVITDSGGLQEETTYLGIPCLTVRENTERPITIEEGTNRLVSPLTLAAELAEALATPRQDRKRPDRWDGRTARRCLEDLRRRSAIPEAASYRRAS